MQENVLIGTMIKISLDNLFYIFITCCRLATANIDDSNDTITYTQFLDSDGFLQADITISKLDYDKFLVVATDTAHRHVETHFIRNLNPLGNKNVNCIDVTGGYSQLNIQGPLSRQFLQQLTSVDMSNESFPFRTIRDIDIGFAVVKCARITYVGELGYELHIPSEHALHVFERIREVANSYADFAYAGLKALGSLRMEKAYKDYGHDLDNT